MAGARRATALRAGYAIEREFDDLAAVVDAIAAETGGPVDVVGHSYGGRIALGAALRTDELRRVVCYEGAPPGPGPGYQAADAGTVRRVEELVAAGDRDEALATFMRDIVGMPEADLAAFRADPIWPRRAAAIDTTIRELRAETSRPARSRPSAPSASRSSRSSAAASRPVRRGDARAGRAACGTGGSSRSTARATRPTTPTPPEFVAAIEAFLAEPDMAD